ncbi:hypothetical protein KGQ72_02300 [Patescibacteria group bacterium]|nr:hypothetical protein [Patescibacteria group bacterium]
MKKLTKFAAGLAFVASCSVPLLAGAQPNTSGCVTDGGYCTVGGVGGTCASSPEGFYCQTAQSSSGGGINLSVITPYSEGIKNLINDVLVPVLFALAFIVFLWGVYKYFILGAADEKSRADGRQFVLWGIIGFVVITAVWGFVNIVKDTLFPSTSTVKTTAPAPPTI